MGTGKVELYRLYDTKPDPNSIRSSFEKQEKKILKNFASFSSNSRGRINYNWKSDTDESKHRTCYQLDRDRVVYTKAFKRLEFKTQVYIYRLSDHFRTRLTHSFEVSQVARELCRINGLNEDLAEAISMAHDFGHTPFGHIGEVVLDKKLVKLGLTGFCHNENGVRRIILVEDFGRDWTSGERRMGICPTWELAEGILKHSKRRKCKENYIFLNPDKPATLEGQVVAIADEIVQRHSDLYDSLYRKYILQEDHNDLLDRVFGTHKMSLIKQYMYDVHKVFHDNIPETHEELVERTFDTIHFSKEMKAKDNEIHKFLSEYVYKSDLVTTLDFRAEQIVNELFETYYENIDLLPRDWKLIINDDELNKGIYICDYISGMTDKFAIHQYERLFGLRVDL